ncbi:MAG TPA: exodeoxyribonuclease III, partial [Vicinamibacterales bacterium]|nr:exodeoxyribonuclease III [Vicinamibacterales bacterium]
MRAVGDGPAQRQVAEDGHVRAQKDGVWARDAIPRLKPWREPVMTVGRMKLISWNINGVRSVLKKGFLEILADSRADVFCVQETKCQPGDVQHVAWPKGLEPVWNSAQKKGYAGTAMFLRRKPLNVTFGLGAPEHDTEGRVITAEFPDWWLVTVYTPNSQRGLTRLDYRVKGWDPVFLKYLKKL